MKKIGFLVLVVLSCSRSSPVSQSPVVEHSIPIVVSQKRTDLLYSYIDATGQYHDTQSVEEIPEASRAKVLVRDLSKSADELRSADDVYVADVRVANDQGVYPCEVVSRSSFERSGKYQATMAVAAASAAKGDALVTVFSASWCGVCQTAKAYLKRKQIPYLERDIEKDPTAQQDLAQRAKAAQIPPPQGIPVIDVAGSLMVGFDEPSLDALLEKKGLSKTL